MPQGNANIGFLKVSTVINGGKFVSDINNENLLPVRESHKWSENCNICLSVAYLCETVAISRAREGMFILGNAENLSSRSRMWRSIIDELEDEDAVGQALPVVCYRHPDSIKYVSEPDQLPNFAPDGKLNQSE